VTDYLKIYQ